jgi:large subunit ribosomal protein L18
VKASCRLNPRPVICSRSGAILSVYKSNQFVYAQLLDDDKGVTLAYEASDKKDGTKLEGAQKVGARIAEKAKGLKIEKVVFDRGGFIYTGKIRALAEAAREGGLKF